MATQTQADLRGAVARPPAGSVLGAILLAGGFFAYIASILLDQPLATDLSAVLILCFIALNLGRASRIVQMFAAASVLIALAGWVSGTITLADYGVAAGRVAFLTSILVALIFLRLVAQHDAAFAAAGGFLAAIAALCLAWDRRQSVWRAAEPWRAWPADRDDASRPTPDGGCKRRQQRRA